MFIFKFSKIQNGNVFKKEFCARLLPSKEEVLKRINDNEIIVPNTKIIVDSFVEVDEEQYFNFSFFEKGEKLKGTIKNIICDYTEAGRPPYILEMENNGELFRMRITGAMRKSYEWKEYIGSSVEIVCRGFSNTGRKDVYRSLDVSIHELN